MINWNDFLSECNAEKTVGDYYNSTTTPYNPFQKEKQSDR